jgi:membrane protein YdbS with pleckstrin-like domain
VIGLIGAVEAGVGLWYFTNGHWINGIFYVTAVVFLISVFIRRERKLKGPGRPRRY